MNQRGRQSHVRTPTGGDPLVLLPGPDPDRPRTALLPPDGPRPCDRPATDDHRRRPSADALTRRTVTTTMITIALLTFAFSFGNVWALGLRLGVAPWLAPLIGPAVDLSVIGLIVGIRHLTLMGVTTAELRPARLLLAFSGLATLALNVAEPAIQGQYGKAAFDAVGPLLLIGWSEVGPYLLSRLHHAQTAPVVHRAEDSPSPDPHPDPVAPAAALTPALLLRAREIDRDHRDRTGGRPASAELRSAVRVAGGIPGPRADEDHPQAGAGTTRWLRNSRSSPLKRRPKASPNSRPATSARS
ncbi:hypothetical protein HNP84_010303 [Thermocatellispora tengchongensis]|uniref:DUF2637 domain-containing protein n=1 Tax=Thermocatellispora tengchongensis TaxID=1073253 RepID=A0A840PXF6_9ACTN|nr:hypothetical protein [Thermocatellispora tengchongensis]MBB5140535.1 hypothetical protein [Thermocatellispora tengchongensis]